jgi:hypothetical protein
MRSWFRGFPACGLVGLGPECLLALAVATSACGSTPTTPAPSLPGPPLASSGVISACGAYPGPGPYTLTASVTGFTPCLTFSASASLSLDCQGHDASSIKLFNVHGASVRNCLMHGSTPMASGALINLLISGGSAITIESSEVLGGVTEQACQGCTFSNDSFLPAGDQSAVSCELCLEGGQSTSVIGSTIDGGGCDDAILLVSEGKSVLQENTIRNAWDAGIEAAGNTTPVTATIENNSIASAGVTGIGAYYIAGWQNSVFSGNTVSNTPDLLWLVAPSATATGVTVMTLVNNQITNNILMNPVVLASDGQFQPSIFINYLNNGRPYTVSGNVLRNNNLGTSTPGPMLSPASGFIDGGGNVCGPGGTLMCSGGGAMRRLAAPTGRLLLPPTSALRPPLTRRRR